MPLKLLRFGVFWELTILNVPEKSPNTIMQLSRSDRQKFLNLIWIKRH